MGTIPGGRKGNPEESNVGACGVCISLAQVHDARRLVNIHFDAVHAIADGVYPPEVLRSWSPTPSVRRYDWMQERLCSDSHLVLVAKLRNEICGFAIGALHEGFIQAIYVHPNHAGQGIGRSLLEETENQLLQAGRHLIKLNASTNSAGFYQSMGYLLIAQATQSLADGSEMSCFEMHKELTRADP